MKLRSSDPVVELTPLVTVVHQNHAYRHVKGGWEEAHLGIEAQRNRALAGGVRNLYTLDDTTHTLGPHGLRRHHLRAWRLAHRWSRLKYRLHTCCSHGN